MTIIILLYAIISLLLLYLRLTLFVGNYIIAGDVAGYIKHITNGQIGHLKEILGYLRKKLVNESLYNNKITMEKNIMSVLVSPYLVDYLRSCVRGLPDVKTMTQGAKRLCDRALSGEIIQSSLDGMEQSSVDALVSQGIIYLSANDCYAFSSRLSARVYFIDRYVPSKRRPVSANTVNSLPKLLRRVVEVMKPSQLLGNDFTS